MSNVCWQLVANVMTLLVIYTSSRKWGIIKQKLWLPAHISASGKSWWGWMTRAVWFWFLGGGWGGVQYFLPACTSSQSFLEFLEALQGRKCLCIGTFAFPLPSIPTDNKTWVGYNFIQGRKMLTVRGEASELFPKEMSGDRLMEIESHVSPYLCALWREDFFCCLQWWVGRHHIYSLLSVSLNKRKWAGCGALMVRLV